MPGESHNRLVDGLKEKHGAKTHDFKNKLIDAVADHFANGIVEAIRKCGVVPDAWRIAESTQFPDSLDVFVYEVEVTNRLSDWKLLAYYNLWFALDTTFNLRLIAVDRLGNETEIDLHSAIEGSPCAAHAGAQRANFIAKSLGIDVSKVGLGNLVGDRR